MKNITAVGDDPRTIGVGKQLSTHCPTKTFYAEREKMHVLQLDSKVINSNVRFCMRRSISALTLRPMAKYRLVFCW